MIKPFQEIDFTLLDDFTDRSSIELDGITLVSGNEFDPDDENIQHEIHDTIKRVSGILQQYRDGKLVELRD